MQPTSRKLTSPHREAKATNATPPSFAEAFPVVSLKANSRSPVAMLGLNEVWCWKASRSKKAYLGPAALNASKISSSRGLRSHEFRKKILIDARWPRQSLTSAFGPRRAPAQAIRR